jgi:hypothetical protein
VNGGAPAGESTARSSEIAVLQNGLITMKTQMRAVLKMVSRLVHEKTAATVSGGFLPLLK